MKKAYILVLIVVTAAVFEAQSQKAAVFNNKGIAVNGYDVVAYFTKSKPLKGSSQFSFNWNSATWYFADQDDLDLFKANPYKYAPQYGGYCAYGASEKHKAPTQPEVWSIVNGKLYLNYNSDVQKDWKSSESKRIADADKYWPSIKDKE